GCLLVSSISRPVPSDLFGPVVGIRMWLGCELATFVTVPEAAMDEYRPPPGLVCEVGFSWKICHVDPKALSKRMHGRSRSNFRLGILRADPPHHFRACQRLSQAPRRNLWRF